MATTKVTYLGDLRTLSIHLASGSEIISDAPIDNNGKGRTYSEINRADSTYRQCIKDPKYHGNTSSVDPHLRYDIEKRKQIEIR